MTSLRRRRRHLAAGLAADAVDDAEDAARRVEDRQVFVVQRARGPDACAPPRSGRRPCTVRTSATVVHPREPEQARRAGGKRREKHEVQPVQRSSSPWRLAREVDDERVGQLDAGGRRRSRVRRRAGARRPAPFTAGGIATPSTDVPQLLASWMKKRPDCVAPEPAVLARHLRRREHLHVHPDGAAAAADRQRVLAHAELVMPLLVVVGQRGALAQVVLG